MDDLFVRHTYLSAVIGMVVQASFGGDIRRLAEDDPTDLLLGRDFRSKTGLQGVVESDFFAWPTEVGGTPLLSTLSRRIARFDWQKAPNDVAAILYETMIPSDERRQLGEYYTPDWLAKTIVREVVTDPLSQYVLDPACGSGTFVAEAVNHFIEAARETSLNSREVLERLRFSIAGSCAEALEEALDKGQPEVFNTDQSLPLRRQGEASSRVGSSPGSCRTAA